MDYLEQIRIAGLTDPEFFGKAFAALSEELSSTQADRLRFRMLIEKFRPFARPEFLRQKDSWRDEFPRVLASDDTELSDEEKRTYLALVVDEAKSTLSLHAQNLEDLGAATYELPREFGIERGRE